MKIKVYIELQFSCSVMFDSLWPHGLQHSRLPRPSPTLSDSEYGLWRMTYSTISPRALVKWKPHDSSAQRRVESVYAQKCGGSKVPLQHRGKLATPLRSPQLSSHCHLVTQSCLTLCDPMDCSTPGFPVLHYLPEFAQTHVPWVGDAIQPSPPLSPPSPVLNLSQHQGHFQRIGSSHQVAKVLELQHQSFQWVFRVDFLSRWLVWSPCSPGDSIELL